MKKLIFLLAVLVLMLTACDNTGSQPEEPVNQETSIKEYYPVTENAKYTYQGEGNEFASYTMFFDYISDGRSQIRTNNGGTETITVLEIRDDQLTILYSRGETYFRQNFIDKQYEGRNILLKAPLKEGNTWAYDENTKATITGLSKEVVTGLGNYEALEVTLEGDTGKTVNYYAKGIGLVKTISSGEGYEVSSTLSSIENNLPLIQTITLFYPNVEWSLDTVDVQIEFNTNDEPADVIEKVVKDLALNEVLSSGTKINELYFDEEESSVHIDLSEDFIKEMNAGAGFEALILQGLTNTLGNYYGVSKVYLTIDGGPYESGHTYIPVGEPLTVN